MHIQLSNFAIINYNPNDIAHIKFAKDMKEANKKDNFLYNCIDELIEKSSTTENLHLGYGYMVTDNKRIIGYLRPARKVNINTLELDLGIHPDYRNKGYGTKILVEVTDFFLSFEDIKCIKLSIDSSNEYSLKCARKAGYIETSEKYPRQFKTYLKRKWASWK